MTAAQDAGLLGLNQQRSACITEARRQLRAELLLRPDDARILMDLANLLVDLGEIRPALACLTT